MTSDSFELAREFSLTHPEAAALALGTLPRGTGTAFLGELPNDAATAILAAMLPSEAAAHLVDMAKDRMSDIVQGFSPQRAADVMQLLPADLREGLLEGQNTIRRSQIQFYMRQIRGNTGAWVESDVVVARPNERAGDVQGRCSQYRGNISVVYVIDADQSVVGEISALTLVTADPAVLASELMRPVPHVIRASTPIEVAVANDAWRSNDVLPVRGADDRFVGAVRFTVLRHAADDVAKEHPPEITEAGISGLADAWFVGLSDILGASVGRHTGPRQGDAQEGSRP